MHNFLEKDSFGFGLTDEKDTLVDQEPIEDPVMREIDDCFDCIKTALPNITNGNEIMLRFVGSYFEELCFIPPAKIFKYLGVDMTLRPDLMQAQRLDTLHSILNYAPLICNAPENREVVKSLLHYRISRLLSKICLILEQTTSDDAEVKAEGFSAANMVALRSDVKALTDLNTEDIAKCFGLTVEEDLQKISVSIHNLRDGLAKLQAWANIVLDGEMAILGRKHLSDKSLFDMVKNAAHIYGEVFSPTAPSPHSTTGLMHSSVDSLSKMAEEADLEMGVDAEVILDIDDSTVNNGHSVLINRTRFLGIIKNLLRNSYDARRVGEKVRFKISVFESPDNPGYTTIRVNDNGVGLSASVLPHLLLKEISVTPTHAAGKKFGGRGIGLLGSSLLLKDMGGEFGEIKAHGDDPEYGGAQFDLHLKKVWEKQLD